MPVQLTASRWISLSVLCSHEDIDLPSCSAEDVALLPSSTEGNILPLCSFDEAAHSPCFTRYFVPPSCYPEDIEPTSFFMENIALLSGHRTDITPFLGSMEDVSSPMASMRMLLHLLAPPLNFNPFAGFAVTVSHTLHLGPCTTLSYAEEIALPHCQVKGIAYSANSAISGIPINLNQI